jgi:hypothetical protein
MEQITLTNLSPNDAMEIVRELRSLGYQQGLDFDFQYNPPKYDDLDLLQVYNRHTIFSFYTDKLATWFALRYQ